MVEAVSTQKEIEYLKKGIIGLSMRRGSLTSHLPYP